MPSLVKEERPQLPPHAWRLEHARMIGRRFGYVACALAGCCWGTGFFFGKIAFTPSWRRPLRSVSLPLRLPRHAPHCGKAALQPPRMDAAADRSLPRHPPAVSRSVPGSETHHGQPCRAHGGYHARDPRRRSNAFRARAPRAQRAGWRFSGRPTGIVLIVLERQSPRHPRRQPAGAICSSWPRWSSRLAGC